MPADREFDPIQVHSFAAQAIVLVPQNLPKLIQQTGRLGRIGGRDDRRREGCKWKHCAQFKCRLQAAWRHLALLRSKPRVQRIGSSSLGMPRPAPGCITLAPNRKASNCERPRTSSLAVAGLSAIPPVAIQPAAAYRCRAAVPARQYRVALGRSSGVLARGCAGNDCHGGFRRRARSRACQGTGPTRALHEQIQCGGTHLLRAVGDVSAFCYFWWLVKCVAPYSGALTLATSRRIPTA